MDKIPIMRSYSYLKATILCLALLVTGIKATRAQQQTGLLWEITGNDLKQPAWLFGTVHMFDTTMYQLPQAPFELLPKVDKVYFEMDFSKLNPAEMMAAMMITDTTQYLNKLLNTPSLNRLKALGTSSPMIKMMGDKIYAIKPLLLISMLTASATQATMVDLEIFKVAMAQQKPVGGLETTKDQMAAIDQVPITRQAEMMKKYFNHSKSLNQQVSELTAVYAKQHINDLMTQVNDNMPVDASFDQAIRLKRNETMTNKIDSILRTEHPLIAVGGGHLGNSDGLIALLEKKGYQLKSIPFTFQKAHK